ncbi:MAG: hypothetical protein KR126chlam2_00094 [Chlamydiae bacterium]|nr:hypothetical protein [Chlamydiota bacterium]
MKAVHTLGSHQSSLPTYRAERAGAIALLALGLILAAGAVVAQFQGLGSVGVAALLGVAGVSLVASIVLLAIIPRRKPLPPPEPKKCDSEAEEKRQSQASLELSELGIDDLDDPILLHKAAQKGSVHALHRGISQPGGMARLGISDRSGDIPLHVAIHACQAGTVQWLASTKVGVNQPNREGKTPLQQIAELRGHEHEDTKAMTEAMMEYSGDVAIQDRSGNTLLHLAAISDNCGTLAALLEHSPEAAKSNNVAGDSPLYHAINHNSVAAIRLLVPYSIVTQRLCDLFKGREGQHDPADFDEIYRLLTQKMNEEVDVKSSL